MLLAATSALHGEALLRTLAKALPGDVMLRIATIALHGDPRLQPERFYAPNCDKCSSQTCSAPTERMPCYRGSEQQILCTERRDHRFSLSQCPYKPPRSIRPYRKNPELKLLRISSKTQPKNSKVCSPALHFP